MRWPTHLLCLDFETFWSDEYTLKKLTTEEYVRDPQFLAHGAAVGYGLDAPSKWLDDADLRAFLAGVPWDDVALLCQHAQFDGLILSHHYGVTPALYLCTRAMGNMALPRNRHSLKELARHFGLPPKGDAVNLTKGLRELPPLIRQQLGAYACDDVDLTRGVFKHLLPMIPQDELLVIDQTMRLFNQPRLVLNKPRARKYLAKIIRAKRSARQRLKISREDLASTDKFAALLEDCFGLDVELKAGKPRKDGSVKLIPALAKSDPFMKSLLEHEDTDIQAVAALRLAEKSTLEEARLYRLLAMHERGPLAVYINFAAAHTLRWGGGDKMNWQNMPRATPEKPAELRRSIEAPPGYVLVVVDKSQIEARFTLALAEQWDMLELFAKGDPYSAMAIDIYERPINKKDNPLERQLGKVIVLGAGYGMGGRKLRAILRIGAMGAPVMIVSLETATEWITKYRRRHPKVVQYWGQGETALQLLHARVEGQPWGPMGIDRGYIYMPNGTRLDYTGLVREEGEWRMRNAAGDLMRNALGLPIRLYGGMITENVVQAISRANLAQDIAAMARDGVFRKWPLVMTTHDENVALAPEREGDECRRVMIDYMTRRPSWMPNIPLAAEGDFDVCYSK